jgi:glycosyltransferase involved in cell wall biosynthesis
MTQYASIIFIAPQLQQPRVIRRINTVYQAGIPIKVYGFDSGVFSNNLKSISFPVTDIIKRDKKDNKLKKIICFIKTIKRIKKENSNNDIFYLFGTEMGNFSWILRNRKIVYEEADIRGAYSNNRIFRWIFKQIDKGTIKRSLLTVFTSEGFVDYTFGEGKRPDNILVIPNKLNSCFFNGERKSEVIHKPLDVSHIKFGFVGIIRYPNTIVRFAEVIGKFFPQYEFHFFGDPDVPSNIDSVKNMSNIVLHGPFINPMELPSIYNKIDIVISCYDTKSWNVRVAEPNKLYEAVFFEKPIVVSESTFLEKQVKKYNAGYAIKADDDDSIRNFVNSISIESIDEIRMSESKVDWKELIDDTQPFLSRINDIILK